MTGTQQAGGDDWDDDEGEEEEADLRRQLEGDGLQAAQAAAAAPHEGAREVHNMTGSPISVQFSTVCLGSSFPF